MKYLNFLILLMLPFMGLAQNDEPTKQHKFGVGLGYNFNSVMDDTIRPLEVSLRYKLNDKHTFQLYVPFLKSSISLRSEWPSFHYIQTVFEVKKKAIGVGISYDYVPVSLLFFDFFVGMRAEYASYCYETNILNHNNWFGDRAYDNTFYSKTNDYFAISPNVGVGVKWLGVCFDARFMLSGYFFDKQVDPIVSTEVEYPEEIFKSTMDWDKLSESGFKTNWNVVVSASYYF